MTTTLTHEAAGLLWSDPFQQTSRPAAEHDVTTLGGSDRFLHREAIENRDAGTRSAARAAAPGTKPCGAHLAGHTPCSRAC